jgi:hypothetical protein
VELLSRQLVVMKYTFLDREETMLKFVTMRKIQVLRRVTKNM